jgi:cathepsin D
MNIYYGSGEVKGVLSEDTVSWGGISVSGITFGEMTYLSKSFGSTKPDGILGMGWQAIAQDKLVPVFQQMFKQGLVDNNSFSFYLSAKPYEEGSKLVLGGIDESLYTGDITYHKLSSDSYWQIAVADMTLNGTA